MKLHNRVRKLLIIPFCIVAGLSAGCATAPTPQEIAAIGYGSPITIDYQKAIRAHFEHLLLDPYSAHFYFETPRPVWFKDPLVSSQLYVGYGVPVMVNSRNRMGGYVGQKPFLVIFRNNQIVKVVDPDTLRITNQY